MDIFGGAGEDSIQSTTDGQMGPQNIRNTEKEQMSPANSRGGCLNAVVKWP